MHISKSSVTISLVVGVYGIALPAKKEAANPYPFERIVAFGDNLSDNGNGSYAHCLINPPNCNAKPYGYKTWTNGPVAVSYLADLLSVPLAYDFAFGEAYGGSKIGATINNSYTPSMYAPDAFEQVANYTSMGNVKSIIGDTLHFLWIGNNDITLAHISTASKNNPAFAKAMADQMEELVQRLVNVGANYIFVPAIYPKQVAPFRKFIASDAQSIANLGRAISQANIAIEKRLKSNFGNKVIYYDAFNFMLNVYQNHDSFGIKYVLPQFCDGYSSHDFDLCITQGQGQLFYWTQYTDMTTEIHSLLATDMALAITTAFQQRSSRE